MVESGPVDRMGGYHAVSCRGLFGFPDHLLLPANGNFNIRSTFSPCDYWYRAEYYVCCNKAASCKDCRCFWVYFSLQIL